MKRKFPLAAVCYPLVFCALNFTDSLRAQVYSQNIVGYYNLPLNAGNNYIANQLDAGGGNTLDQIFQPGVPNGTTFTEWDASQLQFLPSSIYNAATGWSINYELNLGEGGLLNAPGAFTNTFVGSVGPAFDATTQTINPPLISGSGLWLLSCSVPLADPTFFDVVGRNPEDGDFVRIFNSLSQTETTTTFDNGLWSNGTPLLAVGQAAFFGLQFQPAPEPATLALLATGAGAVLAGNRRRRK